MSTGFNGCVKLYVLFGEIRCGLDVGGFSREVVLLARVATVCRELINRKFKRSEAEARKSVRRFAADDRELVVFLLRTGSTIQPTESGVCSGRIQTDPTSKISSPILHTTSTQTLARFALERSSNCWNCF